MLRQNYVPWPVTSSSVDKVTGNAYFNRQVMWHWISDMCPTAIVIHHHNVSTIMYMYTHV